MDVAVVEIDCKEKNWQRLLREHLQEGQDVTLLHYDYTRDGRFCEMMAVTFALIFRIDHRHSLGFFRKKA